MLGTCSIIQWFLLDEWRLKDSEDSIVLQMSAIDLKYTAGKYFFQNQGVGNFAGFGFRY